MADELFGVLANKFKRLKDMGDGTHAEAGYDATYGVMPHAYASATSTTTAQTLAQLGVTVPTWATMAFIVPSAAVRYRCDGTAPTSSVGMPIATGQVWPIQGKASLDALLIIGAATLDIEFRG